MQGDVTIYTLQPLRINGIEADDEEGLILRALLKAYDNRHFTDETEIVKYEVHLPHGVTLMHDKGHLDLMDYELVLGAAVFAMGADLGVEHF